MVPFQGVIAILLGCLTFFQWLRPEDEPDSQQEIDPGREWNGEQQMGMSVHNVWVCVCLCSLVKRFFGGYVFPPLSKLTKYFTTSLFLHFLSPSQNKMVAQEETGSFSLEQRKMESLITLYQLI